MNRLLASAKHWADMLLVSLPHRESEEQLRSVHIQLVVVILASEESIDLHLGQQLRFCSSHQRELDMVEEGRDLLYVSVTSSLELFTDLNLERRQVVRVVLEGEVKGGVERKPESNIGVNSKSQE
jgi:cytidylate kinase